MPCRQRFPVALLFLVLVVAAVGWAGDARAADNPLDEELRVKYPKSPKALDEDPQQTSIVLMDFEFHGVIRMNGLDGATLERLDDGERVRARPMKGRLVLFKIDRPGTYSLRFVRVSNPNATIVLERPAAVQLNVTAESGQLGYLGKVVVTSKGGLSEIKMELAYDARQEAEAWSAFRKKYSKSPWIPKVDAHVAALETAEAP